MSWASRRKLIYLSGVALFFLIVIGGPVLFKLLTIPPTCHDGIENQGETAVDEGGPCLALDPRSLQPASVLWARAFAVRGGSYSAVAYVENPNKNAGIRAAHYAFTVYDADNVLISRQSGTGFVMPGGITPIFVSGIDAGNRVVAHTYFKFTDDSLPWESLQNAAQEISVDSASLSNADTAPVVTATARNSGVTDLADASFVATIFDTAGNAIAASATRVDSIPAGASAPLTFTWPTPFPTAVGKIDVIALKAPTAQKGALQ